MGLIVSDVFGLGSGLPLSPSSSYISRECIYLIVQMPTARPGGPAGWDWPTVAGPLGGLARLDSLPCYVPSIDVSQGGCLGLKGVVPGPRAEVSQGPLQDVARVRQRALVKQDVPTACCIKLPAPRGLIRKTPDNLSELTCTATLQRMENSECCAAELCPSKPHFRGFRLSSV